METEEEFQKIEIKESDTSGIIPIYNNIYIRKLLKYGRKEELKEKIVNQSENIRIMEELIRNQKRLITHIQGTLEEKNKMLDALHYVWCDGGCVGGVHRYKEMSNIPLTEETVRKAESNTYRLRMWFVNNKFRKRKITLKYYKTFKYRIREILRKLYFALV